MRLACFWLCLLVPTAAFAQHSDWERLEDSRTENSEEEVESAHEASRLRPVVLHPYSGRIMAETAFFHGNSSFDEGVSSIAPVFSLDYRIADHYQLRASFGFAATVLPEMYESFGEPAVRVGNPSFGFGYVAELGEWPGLWELEVGVLVSAPAATFDTALGVQTHATAAMARGLWNGWDWLTDTMAVMVPVHLENFGSAWRLHADVAAGSLIAVRDNMAGQSFWLQAKARGGYQVAGDALELGLGLSGAGAVSGDDGPFVVSALAFLEGYSSGVIYGLGGGFNLWERDRGDGSLHWNVNATIGAALP